MQRLTVGRRSAARINAGHPWVFANEVRENLKLFERGGRVEVAGPNGGVLGYGYVNPHSLIAARLLARDTAVFDAEFFADRLARAAAYRERFRPGTTSHRLCFGESDGLPGLVVDRYEDLYVVQSHAAGIDALTDEIVSALQRLFDPAGVLLKYDGSARKLEGLDTRLEVVLGEVPDTVQVDMEGSRFALNLTGGQKSGFFHDQAANRARLSEWCSGARVLDVFSYVGAWSLAAARGGAREVVGIDASADAVRLATQSAGLSALADRVRFERADAFDELARRAGETWDVVVLDPPAFVKSKKTLKKGLDGYREINRRGAALVRPGGILATSSCSRHVSREAFVQVVGRALSDVGRSGRIIELGAQGADHPIHPQMPETEYLTCVFVEL